MSLEGILLGLLGEPATGYDIKRDFDQVFSHFWSAEQSQIYRTLQSLEKRGQVTSRTEPSPKGPARRVYRRTTAGHSALLGWLDSSPGLGGLRIPYLAQLYFLGESDDLERTAELLQQIRDHAAERLEVLEGLETLWREGNPDYPRKMIDEDFHPHLVYEHGKSRNRATLEWADESLRRVNRRLARQGASPSDASAPLDSEPKPVEQA